MRLAYINESLRLGLGGGTHAREFLSAVGRLPDVTAVSTWPPRTSSGAGPDPEFKWSHRTLARHVIAYLRPRPSLARTLREFSATTAPDAIVVRHSVSVCGSYGALTRGAKGNRPTVLVEANALLWDEIPMATFCRRWFAANELGRLRRADGISVVSDALRRRIADTRLPAGRILVNHNGVDPDRFHPPSLAERAAARREWGADDETFVLGYVGGMEPFRRLPRMLAQIDAWRKTARIRARLLIVGSGPDMPELRRVAQARNRDGEKWLRLMGPVPHERIPSFMAGLDVALFPYSNPYGSPQKLFEYLAMRLPTIGPAVPAVTEVFAHNRHLWLASQDGTDLHELLSRAFKCRETAMAMADNGRRHVLANYTWAHNATRVVNFLKQQQLRQHAE